MKLAEIITDAKTGEVTFVLTNTMTCQNDNCNMPAYDYRDIIGTYCLEIMIALKKRMDNCLNTMLNPKNTILTAKVVIDYDELNEVLFYIVPDEEI